MKSAGRRTAQHSLCAEWDVLQRDDGESRCCDWAQASAKEVEKEMQRSRKERAETTTESISDLISLTRPQLRLISFHFHFPWLSDQSV